MDASIYVYLVTKINTKCLHMTGGTQLNISVPAILAHTSTEFPKTELASDKTSEPC